MTEPHRETDAPLESQAREAARGESDRTPLFVLGGVGGTIAVVAGTLIALLTLLWWLA